MIISSPRGYKPQYEIAQTYEHTGERDFAEAVNLGVKLARPASEYFLLLSDDTVMTKDSLKNLVGVVQHQDAIVNATSNCDNGWRYSLIFTIEDQAIVGRYFKMEDTEDAGLKDKMQNAESYYPAGVIFTDAVCFYATLIPRKVWDKVGELDTRFKTGYEDTDYCKRAAEKGIRCGIVLSALIWHFGGITSEGYLTKEKTAENARLFKQKWST